MLNNFSRLQPTLSRLGIKLDSKRANGIMTQKRGAALRLLYDVKVAVSGLNRDLMLSRQTQFAKSISIETTPSISVLETQTGNTSQRRPFEEKMHRIFDEVMRVASMPAKAQIEERALAWYSEQAVAQRRSVEEAQASLKAEKLEQQKIFRKELRGTFRGRVTKKQMAEELGRKEHSANQHRWRELERQDLAVELAMQARREEKKAQSHVLAAQDCRDSISDFETTLNRLGKDEVPKSSRDAQPIIDSSPLEHLRAIQARVPDEAVLKKQGAEYVALMKTKRVEAMNARKEKERRRRKLLCDHAQAQRDSEDEKRKEYLFSTLERESTEEQRVSKRLFQLRQEQQVIAENRKVREEQYATRKAQDRDEALKREEALANTRREMYEESSLQEAEKWEAIKEARAQAKRDKNADFCAQLLDALVTVSEKAADHREKTGALVPRKEYLEWVALFAAGVLTADADPSGSSREGEEEGIAGKVLDESSMKDYLGFSGQWEETGLELPQANEELSAIVDAVFASAFEDEGEADLPNINFPYKVAIIGTPFAGKSTIATVLAAELGIAVIGPETAVKDSILAGEDSSADSGAGELGRRAAAVLQEGKQLPDDLLVAIMVQRISSLHASDPEADQPKGFILDGFPRNEAQAALLEKALTGLDLEKVAERESQASVLAAPLAKEKDASDVKPVSGLDAVILLTLSDESLALKRALGRRIDPETGAVYHMELNPPPTDNPGLLERLGDISGDSNDAEQVQERLTTSANQLPLLEAWISKFDKLLCKLDCYASPEELQKSASSHLNLVACAKEAAQANSKTAAAAKEAAERVQAAADAAAAATTAAESAAAELLRAKRAEIDAKETIKDGEGAAEAQELLSGKTAEICAEQLKLAQKAAEEAAAKAQEAAEAATLATAAVKETEERAIDVEASAEAKSAAEKAARDTAEAESLAREAAQRAEAAHLAAREAAARALELSAGESDALKEENTPTQEEEPSEESPAGDDPAQEAPACSTHDIDKEFKRILYDQWRDMEHMYTQGLKQAFRSIREERASSFQHFVTMREEFKQFLDQPDERQNKVSGFQRHFNAVDLDHRRNDDTKSELLLRATELQDSLWDICDKKFADVKAEADRCKEESFVGEKSKVLSILFEAIAQLEADRFLTTSCIVTDHERARFGLDISEEIDHPALNLSDDDQPEELASAVARLEESGGIPEEVLALEEASPALSRTLRQAVAAAGMKSVAAADTPADEEGEEGEGRTADGAEASFAESISRVLKGEQEAYLTRLRLLAMKFSAMLKELKENAALTFEWQADLLQSRYQGECGAVSALIALVQKTIGSESELPYEMRLEGTELVVDEERLALRPPPAEEDVVGDEPPATEGVFKVSQLRNLQSQLQQASREELPVETALEIILRVCSSRGGAPSAWEAASAASIDAVVKLFDHQHTGYVDWRELVASLAAQHFPKMVSALPRHVAETRMAMEAADKDSDGLLDEDQFLGVPMWWEEELPEGDTCVDTNMMAKDMWFSMMAGDDGLLDFRAALLFMTSDRSERDGLVKALICIGETNGRGPPEQLSLKRLERIAYPSGVPAASLIPVPDLTGAYASVSGSVEATSGDNSPDEGAGGRESGGDEHSGPEAEASVAIDAFMGSAEGMALFSSVLSRYVCKDPYTTMAMSLHRRPPSSSEESAEA